MHRILAISFLVLSLSACGAPRYTVQPISEMERGLSVVVVKDRDTRDGFLQTMESWLRRHGYAHRVVAEGAPHDLEKITLEYVGHWAWDLALYLEDARIEAFYGGQRVGEAGYHVPMMTASPSKFGSASQRIDTMMDALFAQMAKANVKK